jgi:hypothetical protein
VNPGISATSLSKIEEPEHNFEFDPVAHTYRLDGEYLPSVTTILKDAGIVDYSKMPEEWREFGMARGRAVHKGCQLISENDLDWSTVGPIEGYLRAYEKFLSEVQVKPISWEQPVYNNLYKFAGSYDVIYEYQGQLLIADLKTTTVPFWTGAQLAAYQMCAKPWPILRWGIGLRKDGTYRVEQFHGATDQAAFLAALAVYNYKRRK